MRYVWRLNLALGSSDSSPKSFLQTVPKRSARVRTSACKSGTVLVHSIKRRALLFSRGVPFSRRIPRYLRFPHGLWIGPGCCGTCAALAFDPVGFTVKTFFTGCLQGVFVGRQQGSRCHVVDMLDVARWPAHRDSAGSRVITDPDQQGRTILGRKAFAAPMFTNQPLVPQFDGDHRSVAVPA